jgi:PAS domain S-box-containing protein
MSDLTRTNRQRSAALERAMARLSSVLAAAQDAIVTIDPEGRITSWNAAAERIFGWSAEEVMGRELHPLIIAPRYQGAAGQGVPVFPRPEGDFLHTTLELEAIRRNGETFPVELSLASFTVEGCRYAVGIVRDITERKRGEERYRRLFEAVPVGLYRSTPDGAILDANPTMVEMLGYTDRQTFIVANAVTFHEDPGVRDELRRRAEREGTVRDLGARLRRLDGMVVDCLMSLSVARDASGAVAWYEGSMRDVSDLAEDGGPSPPVRSAGGRGAACHRGGS